MVLGIFGIWSILLCYSRIMEDWAFLAVDMVAILAHTPGHDNQNTCTVKISY
jgi:hypothetical protein